MTSSVTVLNALRPTPIPLLRSRELPHADRLAARGELVRIDRGVYGAATLWRALPPWDRYLARVHAHALVDPGAVFCLDSAVALWGLGTVGEPHEVHVLADAAGTSRRGTRVQCHTSADARDIRVIDGILVSSHAETATDIARLRHPALALAVVDAALRADPELSVEALVAENARRVTARGRRQARWAIDRGDARADSTLESMSRAAIEWLGFAQPDLQADVLGTGEPVDFHWPRAAIGGEADGHVKYSGRFGAPADVAIAEKQREDRLRRELRGFARWGWSDLAEPWRLRGILVDAGVQIVTAPTAAQLATLSHALRGR